jgi:hypothetical protein
MGVENDGAIEMQRKDVFERSCALVITEHCGLSSGIIELGSFKITELEERARMNNGSVSFFIPASGSGSRMFNFLYKYLQSKEDNPESTRFFDRLNDFCFVEKLPLVVREKIGTTEQSSIAEYILSTGGMNYGDKPKGLIPFHKYKGRAINPFQEQYLQSLPLLNGEGVLHFTVQENYISEIQESIEEYLQSADSGHMLEFSVQNKDTDAYCFRPAGHGALISNLNDLPDGVVLVKNIDNVQPIEQDRSERYWKLLIGVLLQFQDDLAVLYDNYSSDDLAEFNVKYELFRREDLGNITREMIGAMLQMPSRVCGMVKNQGEPGGGPFWIKSQDKVSKQIVEESQISNSEDQLKVLEMSSHFNPVFMALSNRNVLGERVDLTSIVDESKYLKVKKPHEGKDIMYRELPGLWNGSMANWNTVFVELPDSIFSPVKSALDLLEDPHL